MQEFEHTLRRVRLAATGLSLITAGIAVGLLLTTVLPRSLPHTPETAVAPAPTSEPGTRVAPGTPTNPPGAPTAVPASVTNTLIAQQVESRPQEIPDALLPPDANGRTPLDSPFAALAARVVPAVVSVDTRRTIAHPRMRGENFRRFFDEDDDGEIEVPSSGSGFIFDPTGYVFTNDHVVSGADVLSVHLSDGRQYEALVVGSDPHTDVAILKIERASGDPALPVLPLGDSDEIRVGDWAIAVGNPLGELESSVTVGIISAKGRSDLRIAGGGPTYQDFLQTDASINFGNSGGPLVNARGEVIGINSAINPTGQGLGFTIPINMARKIGVELIRTGTVRRGYLGIVPQEVTMSIREVWEMPRLAGILVASVEGGTPAHTAGLEVGDVILEFNQVQVDDVPDFRALVAEAGVGVSVPIRLLREGQERYLEVVLAERPDTPELPRGRQGEGDPDPEQGPFFLGATLADINSRLVRSYDLPVERGVVVTEVERGSAAFQRGLREGDVILELNRNQVRSKDTLETELQSAWNDGAALVLLVQRGTTTTYVELPGRG